MLLTVIICTLNPRPDYLTRVLDALRGQTLPYAKWELLVVDSRSREPLAHSLDLSWHPASRIIREERPGVIWARVRGMEAASTPLIVYVDDDNVLAPDYLETAALLEKRTPFLGVWSACIKGEFEIEPSQWMEPFLPFLALTDFPQDRWANHPDGHTLPIGAGMVVRRQILEAYRDFLHIDQRRLCISRDGNSLLCGEDTDIGLTACKLGFGCGYMSKLHLTHLLPKKRLTKAYLIRLVEDVTASHYWLELSRDVPFFSRTSWLKLHIKGFLGRLLGPSHPLCFEGAKARGYLKGAVLYRQTSTPS